MDSLPEQAALLDGHWNIVSVNPSWERYVERTGYELLRTGGNFRTWINLLATQGHGPAQRAMRAIDEFDCGTRNRFRYGFVGEGPTEGRYFEKILQAFDTPGGRLINLTRYDRTRVHKLRNERRRLGSHLLRTQEEERRRLARDLHDSTSQLLVGLHLNLIRLKQSGRMEQVDLADMEEIIGRVESEIRTFSFLACPPSLVEHGLVIALRATVDGFSRRAELSSEFMADEHIGTPSEDVQRILYRLAQEALANVYRHARSRHVQIRLTSRRSCLHLIVSDDGVGFPKGVTRPRGVGLRAMKDRLADVGGRLSIIAREGHGTTIVASVPNCPGDWRWSFVS